MRVQAAQPASCVNKAPANATAPPRALLMDDAGMPAVELMRWMPPPNGIECAKVVS